jgi:hypothetical protein
VDIVVAYFGPPKGDARHPFEDWGWGERHRDDLESSQRLRFTRRRLRCNRSSSSFEASYDLGSDDDLLSARIEELRARGLVRLFRKSFVLLRGDNEPKENFSPIDWIARGRAEAMPTS